MLLLLHLAVAATAPSAVAAPVAASPTRQPTPPPPLPAVPPHTHGAPEPRLRRRRGFPRRRGPPHWPPDPHPRVRRRQAPPPSHLARPPPLPRLPPPQFPPQLRPRRHPLLALPALRRPPPHLTHLRPRRSRRQVHLCPVPRGHPQPQGRRRPARTVHLSFVPDEEIGGADGAAKFSRSAEFKGLGVWFMLDEGQANPGNEFREFYADRSPWCLTARAVGAPGHGSRL